MQHAVVSAATAPATYPRDSSGLFDSASPAHARAQHTTAEASLRARVGVLAIAQPPAWTLLFYSFVVFVAVALVAYSVSKYVVVPQRSRDCILGSWTDWSGCANGSCNGVATRTRVIESEAQYDGHQCFEPDLLQETPCSMINACDARDCQYGPPQYLSSCSADACYDASTGACMQGSGEQAIFTPILREPLPGGKPCDWSVIYQILPCNVTRTCTTDDPNGPPTDCTMSAWSSFSACPDLGAQCALPGDPLWWSYSYRFPETSASNGGMPCHALDMVRSETCPQNSCTWCSLSWVGSEWSELTYPCGVATAFREADVVTAGNLPCLPQSITVASYGDCALGAFDEMQHAACTGFDFTIPCAGHKLSGAHLPQTLWNLAHGRNTAGLGSGLGDGFGSYGAGYVYSTQNLVGGELQTSTDLEPIPADLADGIIPASPDSGVADYRSFCLMACAEMSSCSGVLWDEADNAGVMLINTISTASAVCAGYSALPPQVPEVFMVALDPDFLARAVSAASASLNSNAEFGGYYALPAVVAQRLVQAQGWTVATSADVLAASAAALEAAANLGESMALPNYSLVAFNLDLSPSALDPSAPHQAFSVFFQNSIWSTDLLAYASRSDELALAEAELQSAQNDFEAALDLVMNAFLPCNGHHFEDAECVAAFAAAAQAQLALGDARAAIVAAEGEITAATIAGQNIAGVWVKGVKPSSPALAALAPGMTATAFSVNGTMWSSIPKPLEEAAPEVFFMQPTPEAWNDAFTFTGEAPAALLEVAMHAGFAPATLEQLLAASLKGLSVPGCIGVANPVWDEWTSQSTMPDAPYEFTHSAPVLYGTEELESNDPNYPNVSMVRVQDPLNLFALTADTHFVTSSVLQAPPFLSLQASDMETALRVGVWVYGNKPMTSLSVPGTALEHVASIAPFAPGTWSSVLMDDQSPLPSGQATSTPLLGGVGGAATPPEGAPTNMTAYVWNPASTNCERVVWPMVGAACLEVCNAGTSDAVQLNHGVQPLLNRGTFEATVFPLSNGKLSCPLTPAMMSASGFCAPDAQGLWTSESCPLSQDCEYQSWSQAGVWGLCNATCGEDGGTRYRVREILQHSTFLGTPCSLFELTESAACHVSSVASAATDMACLPPPSSMNAYNLLLFSPSLQDCAHKCALTGVPGSTRPQDATCTAYEYNGTSHSCRIFTIPGGVDALLELDLCQASAQADMYEPPCATANDCSLTTWSALNSCGACEISYSYQTRSIVAAAQHGGKPCDQFATMRSITCGNVQSCENLPCLYGEWPTTQPQASPADTSACIQFLTTPTLFVDAWDSRYATAMVNMALGAVDGAQPVASLSALVGHLELEESGGGDAGPAPMSWELAQALNAQCLNADGSAPSCVQSFPTSAAARAVGDAAQAFLPLLENWQGRGEVYSWGVDENSRVGWRDVTNGGPQVFLAQFTTNVDALNMTPRVLAASLSAMGWPLATADQVLDVAVRGARVDLPGLFSSSPVPYYALIANADDASLDPFSVTTMVANGTAAFSTLEEVAADLETTGSTMDVLFGAWIYAPKPVQGTVFSLFEPQPFFKVTTGNTSGVAITSATLWDVPPLGATVWPQKQPAGMVFSGDIFGSADDVAMHCSAQGYLGFFHYVQGNYNDGSTAFGFCTSFAQSLSQFLGPPGAPTVPMLRNGADVYVFNPTRAAGFAGLTPEFNYEYGTPAVDIPLATNQQPVNIALQQALTSCSDMGFHGMQYDAIGGFGHCFSLGSGVTIQDALDASNYTASEAGNNNTGEGWDTFVFRSLSTQGERGWTRIPNARIEDSVVSQALAVDPFDVNGIPITELSISQFCASQGHAGVMFCKDAVNGVGEDARLHVCVDALTHFPLRDALNPENHIPDDTFVTTVFNTGNANTYCPAGTSYDSDGSVMNGSIDAGWTACALERLEIAGADARLMFSTTAWSCPSLCPSVPHFCSWSDCDATCSSTIYPGQRSMMRAVTQYAVGVDTLYPCSPLGVLSQTGCLPGMPICQNDCPLGVDGSPCNNTTNRLNECELNGSCTCAESSSANCDFTCSLGSNRLPCGGMLRGDCLPSGSCRCKNGWWGFTCDNVPAVMLGNSSLVLSLADADAKGGALASYNFGATSQYPYLSTGAAACSAANPSACDLCVPYTYAIEGNEMAAPWIPAKYLSVLFTTSEDGIESFADVCSQFWFGASHVVSTSNTLAEILVDTPPAAIPGTWWAFQRP